jgi:DNA-binding CsgD family transcriptional regulator
MIGAVIGNRAAHSDRPAGIGADEHRRLDAVLEAAEGARSLGELLTTTLAALEEHLGYPKSTFMLTLAEPPLSGRRAYGGVTHGGPASVLEEYFERWADVDPLGSPAAQLSYVRRGSASIVELYPSLDRSRRRFVDEFLRRTFGQRQLSYRLPVRATDAYLTLLGSEEFGPRDERRICALLPDLRELLSGYLPRGLDAPLSLRETQTVELVALGFSNREIAKVMHIEEDTVKKHVSRALAKLEIERRAALAVAWATGRRLEITKAIPPSPR